MGGKLLTSHFKLPEKRLPAEEFYALASQMQYDLDHMVNFGQSPYSIPLRVRAIPAYKSKESFGDLDVLVETHNVINWEDIGKHFSDTGEVHRNSGVVSFPYKGFQVDLITCSPAKYEFAYRYFSYNDMGNLLGRVAHKFGLSFGDAGLKYIIREELFDSSIRENSHILDEVVLTLDFDEALEFLGYDPAKMKEFENLDEIFEFVASGKYFNPDTYLLDNLNHQQRTRDRKRPTYNAFLAWCAERQGDMPHHEFKRKRDYLPWLCEVFPNLGDELQKHASQFYFKREYKSRLNGRIVADVIGSEDGPMIGKIMKAMREKFDPSLIVCMRDEWIKTEILREQTKILHQ